MLHKISQEMKIHREAERTYPLYISKLDNGVTINVYGDYAVGDNGKRYYHVGYEEDDMLVTLGWSCEADSSVII